MRRWAPFAALAALSVAACAAVLGIEDLPTTSPGDDGGPDAASEGGVCAPGTADCDGDPKNGCETITDTDPAHCGYCTNACPARANGFPVCLAGKCRVGCNSGFDDCDGDESNGCEKVVTSDPANCGACKHDCLGAACNAGVCEPVTLATGYATVTAVAVNASDLYWYADGNGDGDGGATGTFRLPGKSPGIVGKLPDFVGGTAPVAIVVDDKRIYDFSGHSCVLPDCDGGPATYPLCGHIPIGVAVDDASVYFACLNQSVVSVPKVPDAGGCVDRGGLRTSGIPYTIVVDDAHAFVAGGVPIWFMDKNQVDGGGTYLVADAGPAGALRIAGSAADIFWGNQDKLYACAKTGCIVPRIVGTYPTGVVALVTDETNIYFTSLGSVSTGHSDGAILRCPLTGCVGNPVVLAKQQQAPEAIAVDATHVYWGTGSKAADAKVMKVAK